MAVAEMTIGGLLQAIFGAIFSRIDWIGVLLIAAMGVGIFIHVFRRSFLGEGLGWYDHIYEYKPGTRHGFDILQRIIHPFTWISIGGLMLTGVLTYTGLLPFETSQPIHYLLAWVLIFTFAIHLIWDAILHPSRLPDEMIWPDDIMSLIKIPLNFLGLTKEYPPQGRFGSLEKMPHLAIVFLVPVQIITGLMLLGGRDVFILSSIGSWAIFQDSMALLGGRKVILGIHLLSFFIIASVQVLHPYFGMIPANRTKFKEMFGDYTGTNPIGRIWGYLGFFIGIGFIAMMIFIGAVVTSHRLVPSTPTTFYNGQCNECHGLYPGDMQAIDGWHGTIERHKADRIYFTKGNEELVMSYLTANADYVPFEGPPFYMKNCATCHPAYKPSLKTFEEWVPVVEDMAAKGAGIPDSDVQEILEYLKKEAKK
ncbi:MAG: cytochrome b/b6 domain-containing protein [Candidatus Hydrothermarchaeales archaeon]